MPFQCYSLMSVTYQCAKLKGLTLFLNDTSKSNNVEFWLCHSMNVKTGEKRNGTWHFLLMSQFSVSNDSGIS